MLWVDAPAVPASDAVAKGLERGVVVAGDDGSAVEQGAVGGGDGDAKREHSGGRTTRTSEDGRDAQFRRVPLVRVHELSDPRVAHGHRQYSFSPETRLYETMVWKTFVQ